jgi:hypothetical protein
MFAPERFGCLLGDLARQVWEGYGELAGGGAEDIGAHGEMDEIGADAWQRSDGAVKTGGRVCRGDRDAADLYRAPIGGPSPG